MKILLVTNLENKKAIVEDRFIKKAFEEDNNKVDVATIKYDEELDNLYDSYSCKKCMV
ncbi:MAG: hypothetical protein FWC68_04755 [Oscillospiraceae bacterium]|nr:hypothetical protein [Oscillospiraceae bacterium]